MCTAVLSIKPGLPVLLAGVRDELTDRPWEPPGPHWPSYPGLLGGKDLQAGGTLVPVLPSRRRAAWVLNRIGLMAPAATRPLPVELPLPAAPGAPLSVHVLSAFNPFPLLLGDPRT